MVTSIRVEATGDTPGQAKEQIDAVLLRAGFGLGTVADEVYARDGFGYKGRCKVNYEVPMTSDVEHAYDDETKEIAELVGERLKTQDNFPAIATFAGGEISIQNDQPWSG